MIMEMTQECEMSLSFPGRVFALGEKVATPAKLYARLTGRPYRICGTIAGLEAHQNDVIVCTTDELTPHLMERLYVDEQSAGLPGLIFAATPALLEDVCKRQISKLISGIKVNPQRIFIYPMLNFSSFSRGLDTFISGQEAARDLLPKLASGASILSIVGHSDGISLDISHRSVLCPFVSSPAAEGELRPTCQVMGRCTKFPIQPSMAEAQAASWILSLHTLRAEIGVISTCAAVRLRDGVIDPAYGLAASLLSQAAFGAIITTWRKEPGTDDGSHLNSLINDLSGGAMVGVATALLNRSAFCARSGIKFCVVGDPCFALANAPDYAQLPEVSEDASKQAESAHSLPSSTSKQRERSGVDLLGDAILWSLKTNSAYDTCKGKSLAAELTASTNYGNPGCSTDAQSHIGDHLLEFLSPFPWLPGFFQRFCEIEKITEGVDCPVCFAPARVFRLTFPGYSARVREVTSCSSCGDTRDMPSIWRIGLDLTELEEGLVSVAGIPIESQSMICMVNLWGSLYRAYPTNISRESSFSFRLPADLPPVPMFCRILFAHELDLGALSFKVRQMPDGSYARTSAYAADLQFA